MRVRVDPHRVRQVFSELSGSSAFQESRALAEAGGLPVEMLQAMSLRPEILKAFGATGEGVYPGGVLERELKEKVILKASLHNECQFCINSHRAIMRMIGIPDPQIEHLEAPEHLSSREALALDYTTRAIRDANGIGEEFFDRLRREFSDEEIVELTFLIGLISLLNLFNNALRVTYSGDYEGKGAKPDAEACLVQGSRPSTTKGRIPLFDL